MMMPGNQQQMGFPPAMQQPGMMPQQQPYMQQQQYPMMQQQMTPQQMQQMQQQQMQQMMGGGHMPQQPQGGMGGGGGAMMQPHGMMGMYPQGQMNQGGGNAPNMQGFTPQQAKEFNEKQGRLAEQAARQQQKKQQKLMEQQRKLMDEQRKRMEQEMKHRQFQEQQKKLKEFSTIGGRKNFNADTLIDSIIGKSSAPQRTIQTQPAPATMSSSSSGTAMTSTTMAGQQHQQQQEEDDFGDFLGGPSSGGPSSGAANKASSQPTSQQKAPVTSASTPAAPSPTPQAPAPAPAPVQPKKDLMSMMFECSDLSAPKTAKTFKHHTSMKDVVVTASTAQTYQPSKTSRHWGGHEDDTLSELFALPQPKPQPQPQPQLQSLAQPPVSQYQQAPPQQSTGIAPVGPPPVSSAGTPPPPSPGGLYSGLSQLPPWVTGQAPVPQLYTQVLEAATRDGKISTDALYAILVNGSGLPRELLGHLWSLCNKRTPGQLVTEELHLLLAMIAAAQNNLNVATLEVLNTCTHAPVPWLGNNQQQQQQQQDPQQQQQQASPQQHQEEDDFADFQTATSPSSKAPLPVPASPGLPPPGLPPPGLPAPGSVSIASSLSSVTASTAGIPPITVPDSFRNLANPPAGTMKKVKETTSIVSAQEDKYAVFRITDDSSAAASSISAVGVPTTPGGDAAGDTVIDSKGPATPTNNATSSTSPGGFADFSAFREALPSSNNDSSSSAGFAAFSSAPSTGWPTTSTTTTTPSKPNPSIDDGDDFAEFQDHTKTTTTSDKYDKFAAIKALVMDKSKFSHTPVLKDANDVEANVADSQGSIRDDNWGHIMSPLEDTSQSNSSESTNKFDSFIPSSDIDATSSSSDLFSSSHTTNDRDGEEDDWSNFEAADPTPVVSQLEWGGAVRNSGIKKSTSWTSSTSTEKQEKTPPAATKPNSLKVDPKKAYGMFRHNMQPATHASNFAALDTEPPDFPADEEDDDGFDKFGTFQSVGEGVSSSAHSVPFDASPSAGLSSLITPYGGLEDFGGSDYGIGNAGESATSITPAMNNTTTNKSQLPKPVSMPSIDYNEWKMNSSDTQSSKSLDFRQGGNKENTPSDSQSISSFEFTAATSDSRKSMTPQDARSIASLELFGSSTQDGSNAVTPATEEHFPVRETQSTGDASSDTQLPPEEQQHLGPFTSSSGLTITSNTSLNHRASDGSLGSVPIDIKEMLTKGDLPNLGDRYSGVSDLMKEPEDSERHAYDWKRCLLKCQEMICEANNTFNSIQSTELLEEVLDSHKGQDYIRGIVEIYRVVCRIRTTMKAVSISNSELEECVAEAGLAWGNLAVFIADTPLMPESSVMDFSRCVLTGDATDANSAAVCGLCLLSVDVQSGRLNHGGNGGTTSQHKLTYGGRQYHAACANFWVNCVDSTLPVLRLPELL